MLARVGSVPVVGQQAVRKNEPPALIALEVVGPLEQPSLLAAVLWQLDLGRGDRAARHRLVSVRRRGRWRRGRGRHYPAARRCLGLSPRGCGSSISDTTSGAAGTRRCCSSCRATLCRRSTPDDDETSRRRGSSRWCGRAAAAIAAGGWTATPATGPGPASATSASYEAQLT